MSSKKNWNSPEIVTVTQGQEINYSKSSSSVQVSDNY